MPSSQRYLENTLRFLANYSEKSEQVYWMSFPNLKKLHYINSAYEKIWSRDPKPLYKTSDVWIDYIHADDIKKYHPLHAMADNVTNLGPEAKFSETYRIVRPNKEVRWIVDRGCSICDPKGNVIAVSGVAIDITEDKKIFENALENFYSISLEGKLSKKNSALTNRELQCISLLMRGHTSKMIANKLNLSRRTVEFYIENIKQKFGCTHKSQLIELCWRTIS